MFEDSWTSVIVDLIFGTNGLFCMFSHVYNDLGDSKQHSHSTL